jgi:hypothetical protein
MEWKIIVKDTFNSITIRWIYSEKYLTFDLLKEVEMPSTFRSPSAASNLQPDLPDCPNKNELFLHIQILNFIGSHGQRFQETIPYEVGEFSLHGILLLHFEVQLQWSHQSQPFYQTKGFQAPMFMQIKQKYVSIFPFFIHFLIIITIINHQSSIIT